MWPFRKAETRESEGYEELLLGAFVDGATNAGASAATGALQACSGIYGRAFASASVEPANVRRTGLTPSTLGQIGMQLCRTGEIVFRIATEGGRVELQQAGFHDVYGGPRRSDWTYRVSTYGPSGTETYHLPRSAVVHVQHFTTPLRPWVGLSPLQWAAYTGALSANLERAMSEEAGTPTGYVIPTPEGVSVPSAFKTALNDLKGKLQFPKGFSGGLGDRSTAEDWKPRRIGAQFAAAQVQALEIVQTMVAGACGIPPVLVSAKGDASALREGYRQALHLTIRPLARMVGEQLSDALGVPIVLDFAELKAADIATAARAYGVFRKAEMSDADARRLSGL